MLHIRKIEDGTAIYKALGSELRVGIIKVLQENKEMNMHEMAAALHVSNGALTTHIKKLVACGLLKELKNTEGHGNQKRYRICKDKILIDIIPEGQQDERNIYETDVKIGHYSDYFVYPTCGLATPTGLVGEVDDPRFFAHAKRVEAEILWFTKGHVEYIIPNLLPASQKIDEIMLSMELSSEAPGVNSDWPSDITFALNDREIGTWTSPGDFGDVRGIFTPDWWFPNWNQYGLLKMIVVNQQGTFIDGLKISDITMEEFGLDYRSPIRLKLMVKEDSRNVGGMTIFGKHFGNYKQDIKVRINYSAM